MADDKRAVDAGKIEDEPEKKNTNAAGQPVIHIRVSSPFKIFFDEEALSISAVNDTGPFDILPRHHNFITLLNACEIVVRTVRGEFRIQISGGIMHVKADQIVVFLNV
jgi:F0F1-type ATP synthase epsilon subunit